MPTHPRLGDGNPDLQLLMVTHPRLADAEIAEGGAFVAVGLGHMLGDAGLLARLRAEGCAVKRISPS